MAHAHTPSLEHDKLYVGAVAARLGVPGLFIGIIALALAAWLGLGTPEMRSHFFHSYLAAYSFFLAITLGSIIFVIIQYLARAGWSVTVRRLAERLGLNMFLMAILLVPLVAGMKDLFHWMYADGPGTGEELHNTGYLNPTFFCIRIVAYFVIWCFVAWFFSTQSKRQDATGNARITRVLELLGAPVIILFAFSLTGFTFDWIMSLNPHWFSTIFGVYFFAGCMLSALSSIVLLSLTLKKRGLIGAAINHDHYHDLGKLMFAFTFFWGYIAFSQYMLIWYANLPEETQFYSPRQIGVWAVITIMLLCVHLLIPFPGLLSRHVKRKNSVIAFWAVWSLCACALDIYWLVIPNQWISQIPAEVGDKHMALQDALPLLVGGTRDIYTLNPMHAAFIEKINFPLQPLPVLVTALCFIGIGGLYVFTTMLALRGTSLVPLKDPRLMESLTFENV
jgi:hypothetical protein